ncbi:MAG: hypothetical protein FWD24_05200 [Treponema sp.]|nr:hypothetical protein [Treponema sp.]
MKFQSLITHFTLIIIISFPVYSYEETENYSDSIFIINSFTFNINGITRPYAVINKADLAQGEEISGFSNLEKYILNKQQLLINERIFESVIIEYTVGQVRYDGKNEVDLIINIYDTWNIVAIPRPQYSSSTGFDITIKGRDYNFLGTMNPLKLDIGYSRDIEGRNFFSFLLNSDIPFRLFGLNWNFIFDHDIIYRPDMELNWYYKNVTGLSIDIPISFTTPKFGFNVHLIYNEENEDFEKSLYGNFQEGFYISSRPFITWKIPIVFFPDNYGEIVYTPEITAVFNHEISPWVLSDNKKGPYLNFNHSINFGRIDWIENFQRGFYASLSNSFNYDFYESEENPHPLKSDVRFLFTGHFLFNDFFGFSLRFIYLHLFNSINYNAGDVLRGVIDNEIKADFMISLNLDLPIRVLRIRPSERLNSGIRVFDIDIHLSPIIDIALYKNPEKSGLFNKNNLLFSGGFEFIVFPDFFRSLYLRISASWNFSDISSRIPMELFIGTDLHY